MEFTQATPLASSNPRWTDRLVSHPQEHQCLSFNGLLFAPLGSADLAGCHGMFKVKSGTDYLLYGLDGKVRAFIVNNSRQGHFVVSASEAHGQTRFMFSTSSLEERWLDLVDVGLMKEDDLVRDCRLIHRPEVVFPVIQRQPRCAL